MTRRRRVYVSVLMLVGCLAALVLWPSSAPAWNPLRRRAPEVEEGNAALRAGDADRALAAFERAARRLPDDPGVQLSRGLALMERGDLPGARDAFLSAAAPSAPPELRADAYANLGLAFYREGEAMARAEDHAQAQQLFREAVDALRRSLGIRPGDRETAWNLELAARRLREEREKQEEQEQEQEQESGGQEQGQEQEGQGQEESGGQEQPRDPQGAQPQEPSPEQEGQDPPQETGGQEQEPPQDDATAPNDGGSEGREPQPEPRDLPQGQALPDDARRLLDSLQDDEDNLQRLRARERANRERRRPLQDW